MSELYGIAAGIQQGTKDLDAHRMNQLSMQEQQIQVKSAEENLKRQDAFIQKLNQMDMTGQDPATAMYHMADAAAATGNPAQAEKYMTTASKLEGNKALMEKRQADMKVKYAELAGNLARGMHDQQSFDTAIMQWETSTGMKSPYRGYKYSPELRDAIINETTSVKDNAAMINAKAHEKQVASQERLEKAREPLIKAQTEAAQALAASRKKAGGANANVKAGLVSQVDKAIQSEFQIDNKSMSRTLALNVAERAQDIQAQTGITESQAIKRAMKEAEEDGTLGGLSRQVAPKGSRANPMPLPPKGSPLSKLQDNLYYPTSKGVLRWDAKNGVFTDDPPPDAGDGGDMVDEQDTEE